MDDLTYSIMELVVIVAVILIARCLVPLLKEWIGAENLREVQVWAETAVRYAEQVMTTSTGAEKKAYVVEYLTKLCTDNNIKITEDQMDKLIEAAVKTMHMEDPERIKITSAETSNDQ